MGEKEKKVLPVHVHVPYWRFEEYKALLKASGLGAEIFIGAHTIDNVTEKGLLDIKEFMDRTGSISVHAPFMDLSPGAVDRLVAEATLTRFMQVMSFAEILRPKVIVFHAGYDKWRYAGNIELWLKQSLNTWRTILEKAERLGARIAIENVTDSEPGHLVRLIEEVDHELFGLCLDVGHREVFSELTASEWVDAAEKYLFELHLHDNNGGFDDHLPIGSGRVDFNALFARVGSLAAQPVYTLEAHSPEDAVISIERLGGYAGFEHLRERRS